jgi:DNA polymerase-4
LTFIGPSKVIPFLEALPIEKFFGVGKVTAQKMKSKGIHYGVDLKRFSEEQLQQSFGKSGRFFYHMVRGKDDRPVRPNRITKSISVEDTFETNLSQREDLVKELQVLSENLHRRVTAKKKTGRTVTLKVKFSDFSQVTRSVTELYYMDSFDDIYSRIQNLLDKVDLADKKVRLLGVGLSNFYDQDLEKLSNGQLSLFDYPH